MNRGNVAVKDERIVSVRSALIEEAAVRVDGEGLLACPGFIDFYAHLNVTLLVNPRAESAIGHGITTQVCGNSGFSAAPLTSEEAADLQRVSRYAALAEAIPSA